MNRSDLQAISRLRVREARALLQARFFEGAYYLLGYSVECALKSCIARKVQRYDFPDKKTVNDSYVHNLDQLLGIAGLRTKLNTDSATSPVLSVNWSVVKDWSENARYLQIVPEQQAKDLYSACVSRRHGVLTWLKQSW